MFQSAVLLSLVVVSVAREQKYFTFQPFTSLRVEGPIGVYIQKGPSVLAVRKETGSSTNPLLMEAPGQELRIVQTAFDPRVSILLSKSFPLRYVTALNGARIFDENLALQNNALFQSRNHSSIVASNVKGGVIGLRSSVNSQIYLASGQVNTMNANASDTSVVTLGRPFSMARQATVRVKNNSMVDILGRKSYRSAP